MSQGTAIVSLITSITDAQNLLQGKVYPNEREQGENPPCIVYESVSTTYRYNDSGRTLSSAYYDLFLYANSFTELENLMEAIDTIDTLSGNYGGETVKVVRLNDSGDGDFSEEIGFHTQRIEIEIIFG